MDKLSQISFALTRMKSQSQCLGCECGFEHRGTTGWQLEQKKLDTRTSRNAWTQGRRSSTKVFLVLGLLIRQVWAGSAHRDTRILRIILFSPTASVPVANSPAACHQFLLRFLLSLLSAGSWDQPMHGMFCLVWCFNTQSERSLLSQVRFCTSILEPFRRYHPSLLRESSHD